MSGFEAGLGAQLHLRTAWDTCVQAIEGLELHSVIDRGGFATVFKGWAATVPLPRHSPLTAYLQSVYRGWDPMQPLPLVITAGLVSQEIMKCAGGLAG